MPLPEKKNNTCWQCPDRTAECHASCEKYKAFKEKTEAQRAKRLEAGRTNVNPCDFLNKGFRYKIGRGWVTRGKPKNRT